jgi:uncharacterized protein
MVQGRRERGARAHTVSRSLTRPDAAREPVLVGGRGRTYIAWVPSRSRLVPISPTAAGLALAALIGLSLGLLGGGGSILTVPILVYVVGYEAKPAIAMSLAIVGVVSLVGVAGHWRAGRVRVRTGLAFGAVAMAGAYAGAKIAVYLSGTVQLVLLAVVMLAAAAFMFRNAGARRDPRQPARSQGLPLVVGAGLGVGVLTGLLGIGGGFLIVPALVLLLAIPMKEAVGTSLLVIALNAAAGFGGYLGTVEIAWEFLGAFTGIAIVGIVVGTHLVQHVSTGSLRRGFAVFLVVVGVFILYQNRAVF